jgi:hypothetical protein
MVADHVILGNMVNGTITYVSITRRCELSASAERTR